MSVLTEDGSLVQGMVDERGLNRGRSVRQSARFTLENGELTAELVHGRFSKRREIVWTINTSQIKEMRKEGALFKNLVLRVESPSGGGGSKYWDASIVVGDRDKWMDAIRAEQKNSPVPSVVSTGPVAQTDMKYCPNCGAQMATSVLFCPKCGTKQSV